MEQSPITDKTLGIPQAEYYHEVKKRAQEEEIIRKTKKNKQEKNPKFSIGEKVVITNSSIKSKDYQLVEIIDVDTSTKFDMFSYYGIVLKTTLKNNERLGKLEKFREDNNWFNWQAANVTDTNIKWTFVLEKE